MKLPLALLFLIFSYSVSIAEQGDFVEYGCGGGFSGAVGGIRIYRDGRISEVKKPRVDVPVTEVPAGMDVKSAAIIFALAESDGFLNTTIKVFDNITCFVKYHTLSKDHSVYCGASCDTAPKPVVELVHELNKLRTNPTQK